MIFRRTINAVLAALIAPPCASCGRVLDGPLDGAVCDVCWAAITPRVSCYSLRGIPLAAALGPYDGTLREVVHVLKYGGRRSIAARLGAMMAAGCHDVLAGAEAVVPVPLHRTRLRERGFNQAEDLARHLGPPVVGALRRVKATRPQVELPAAARRTNVHDAFALATRFRNPARSPHPRLRVVVLVDDVATTGATLEACARVLARAGISEVRAVTAARVVPGSH